MDALVGSHLWNKYTKKNDGEDKVEGFTSNNAGVSVVSSIIGLLISCYAVYLSWTCNTAMGVNTGLKIVFAFFAFIFGLLYLIFYVLVNAGRCGVYTPVNK